MSQHVDCRHLPVENEIAVVIVGEDAEHDRSGAFGKPWEPQQMVQRCIPNSVEIGVVLESALVGQFVDSQEGRTSEQIADLIGGLFQMQECYTQQELVKALQDQWKTEGKGKPPGRDRLRELIAEQVDQSISQQSESGKYVYRWLAQ